MNHRTVTVVNTLRALWIVITAWYELGVFFTSVEHCGWPDSPLDSGSLPSHVLLVADPQIIDHRSYPERGPYLTYLTRLVVDLNLRKNWWVALRKKPDVVIFLGDMMDGGRTDTSDDEYETYYRRFTDIFRLPLKVPTYFIPGNHDIGLGTSPLFSSKAHARYISHFGSLNSQISIANHTLVLLDSLSLVEEDIVRIKHAKTYHDWKPQKGGPVEFVKSLAKDRSSNPIILLNHIPLARHTFNCGPLREKGTIRPGGGLGYQNTLGADVTTFLLEKLRPSVIFSGDDHDYCETLHPLTTSGGTSQIREVSVKSLSMAMGIKKPGFQLLSLTPMESNTSNEGVIADTPCLLPDQLSIYLSTYIPLLLVSLLVVLFSNSFRICNHQSRTRQRSRRSSSLRQLPTSHRLQQSGGVSEEENWDDNSFYDLPHPASTPQSKSNIHRHLPHSSLILVQQYCTLCRNSLQQLFSSSRHRKHHSLLGGFIRDTRDIAVFPVTLFVLISIWTIFC